MIVKTYINHENDFWCKMGKFFAFRDYMHEMGGWQFYSKEGSIWFVATIDEKVVGFCSLIKERTHLFFDNFYVLKQYRGQRILSLLFEKGLKVALESKKEIRAITDNPIMIKKFGSVGFEYYGNRGRYKKYKLKNDGANRD